MRLCKGKSFVSMEADHRSGRIILWARDGARNTLESSHFYTPGISSLKIYFVFMRG